MALLNIVPARIPGYIQRTPERVRDVRLANQILNNIASNVRSDAMARDLVREHEDSDSQTLLDALRHEWTTRYNHYCSRQYNLPDGVYYYVNSQLNAALLSVVRTIMDELHSERRQENRRLRRVNSALTERVVELEAQVARFAEMQEAARNYLNNDGGDMDDVILELAE